MPTSRDDAPVPPLVDEYSRLLSFAAHELRSPASVVGGYLRMLQSDNNPAMSARHRTLVDHAARSCARLVELIAELSDVAKLDNHTAAVHVETFDLFTDLVEVAAHIVEGQDRQVTFELTGAAAGAKITGDRRRLTAAFAGLFRALLREQGLPIAICADRRLVHAGGTTAIVVIAPAADVQRVLDRPATTFDERRGGMGLSLPIARRVIQQAGGRLWAPLADSDEDRALKSSAVVAIPIPS
jgi:signal transduction histidine kinase